MDAHARLDMGVSARRRLAALAVLVLVVVGLALWPTDHERGDSSAEAQRSLAPLRTPATSPPPAATGVAPGVGGTLVPDIPFPLTVGGVRLSFSVPTPGWWWAYHNGPYTSKSFRGTSDAEAVVYWAGFPDGSDARPCPSLLGQGIGPSVDDLAAAIATSPGTSLVMGPTEIPPSRHADRLPGRQVVVRIETRIGCDPGFFFRWAPFPDGPSWTAELPGDTVRARIVYLDDARIVIIAATRADTPEAATEVEQILDSVRHRGS
jgi:hypothetical protein